MFAYKHCSSSAFARTALRSSRSNKELIAYLLRLSAITGDYIKYRERRRVAQFRGADNRRRTIHFFMARKLRAPDSPRSVRELWGSPNRTAHRRKVHPYKQSQGRGSAIHDGRQRKPGPSAPIAGEKKKYNELSPSLSTGLSLRDFVGTAVNGESKRTRIETERREWDGKNTPREWFAYMVSRLYGVTQFSSAWG